MSGNGPGRIRLATVGDAEAVHAIYAPIVRDTIISFETDVPDVAQMRGRIASCLEMFPWLAWEREGELLGYAYASRHRDRLAYQWSVDLTCYVATHAHRQGIGAALYRRLLSILRAQGFFNAYAGIALPNEASVRLHESVGFAPLAVYRHVGYKMGAWRDVGWWECAIRPIGAEPPRAPVALRSLGGGILDDL